MEDESSACRPCPVSTLGAGWVGGLPFLHVFFVLFWAFFWLRRSLTRTMIAALSFFCLEILSQTQVRPSRASSQGSTQTYNGTGGDQTRTLAVRPILHARKAVLDGGPVHKRTESASLLYILKSSLVLFVSYIRQI